MLLYHFICYTFQERRRQVVPRRRVVVPRVVVPTAPIVNNVDVPEPRDIAQPEEVAAETEPAAPAAAEPLEGRRRRSLPRHLRPDGDTPIEPGLIWNHLLLFSLVFKKIMACINISTTSHPKCPCDKRNTCSGSSPSSSTWTRPTKKSCHSKRACSSHCWWVGPCSYSWASPGCWPWAGHHRHSPWTGSSWCSRAGCSRCPRAGNSYCHWASPQWWHYLWNLLGTAQKHCLFALRTYLLSRVR